MNFGYDSQGRLTSTSSGSGSFKYYCDNSGNIGYMEDSSNGVKYRYAYDPADRLESIGDDKGNSTINRKTDQCN